MTIEITGAGEWGRRRPREGGASEAIWNDPDVKPKARLSRWLNPRRRPGAARPGPEEELDRLDPTDRAIIERSLPYTMTGIPRIQSLIDAVRYCERRRIAGAFAECGVWRGGSVLAMILALQEIGSADREIFLFDTFEGMTAPTDRDVSSHDPPALDTWRQAEARGVQAWGELFDPGLVNEQTVHKLLADTGYPEARLHFVAGAVEKTVPDAAPEQLALLRLDTDWYESTRHELEHLYPRLTTGGVLIIDDYGHWRGCKRAVDEYFAESPLLMHRVDYTARVAVKP